MVVIIIKVLINTAYYEPEIAASLYLLKNIAEGLAENGFDVTIITPYPTRGIQNKSRFNKKEIFYYNNGSLLIKRYYAGKEHKNTFLRFIRYLYIHCISFVKIMFTKFDIIFIQSTPPTQAFFAIIIKAFKHTPVIYNVQDLFPESMVNSNLIKKRSILYKLAEKIELFARAKSDHIVVISEKFKNNLIKKDSRIKNISIIENWVEEEKVYPIDKKNNKLLIDLGINPDNFIIFYAGNIGHSQNIDLIINVSKKLRIYEDIKIIIIGDGVNKKNLEKRIQTDKLYNLILLPFQEYDNISYVYSIGDVGLIISKKGIGLNSVPSKTWSIMAAQRCVVASFDIDTELGKVISQSNCGYIIDPNDEEKLLKIILLLYQDRNLLSSLGINGRNYIEKNLNKSLQIKKYVNIFKNILKNID